MLAALYVKVTTALPADPYAPKCDLYKAANPIIGWFIGEAKGLLPSIIFFLLFALAVVAIVAAKRIQKSSLRWGIIIVAIALGIGSLYDFISAVSPSPCAGQ